MRAGVALDRPRPSARPRGDALEPGGLLAAFWNRAVWMECALRDPLAHAYATYAPELIADGPMRPGSPAGLPDLWAWFSDEVESDAVFERPELRSYQWLATYTRSAYLELLETHSDHIVLAADRRAALLAAIGAAIDRAGGRFEVPYITRLCLAHLREEPRGASSLGPPN